MTETATPTMQELATMTPTERHNAFARAFNAPVVVERDPSFAGPQGHPHTVVPDAEAGTIGNKPAPPSPQQLEKQNSIEAFDREMVAKGLQRDPNGRFTSQPGEVDQTAVAKRTAEYRTLMETLAPVQTTEAGQRNVAKIRAEYEADMRKLMEGSKSPTASGPLSQPVKGEDYRQLTPAGKTLQDGLLAEFRALPREEQTDPHTRNQYAAALVSIRANEHGNVAAEHFNPESLSGYTLPRLRDDQHYPPSIIFQLADARKAGITQDQLYKFVEAEMTRNGLIK